MKPEEVVSRYFASVREGSYLDAASLLTSEVLARFRDNEAPHHRPRPPLNVQDHLDRNPDLPREVAEYWVAQGARHPPPSISDDFTGVETEQELVALTDNELYARHLEATDHAARFRRQIDALRDRHPEYDAQLQIVRDQQGQGWRFEVLGSLQAKGRAFVLFGWPYPKDESVLLYEPKPNVAVLREMADGWQLAADPSPYSGLGMMMGQIEVTAEDGSTIMLDPNAPA